MRFMFGMGTLVVLGAVGCGSDAPTSESNGPPGGMMAVEISDPALHAGASDGTGWTYWRNRAQDTLTSSSGSGHVERRLRVRYNVKAATQLDAAGRVRGTPSFPDSSLIVKELYSAGRITTLAVMMKLRGSSHASAGGWVWGYFDGSGNVKISLAGRGAACVSCHSAGLDYTRMNDAQP